MDILINGGHTQIPIAKIIAVHRSTICRELKRNAPGKDDQNVLLVMLGRASLVTTIDKINSKKPKHIKKLILKRMKNDPHLKTMTFDNDQIFDLHTLWGSVKKKLHLLLEHSFVSSLKI